MNRSLFSAPEVVLITGATGGIGSALAKLYAEPGRVLVLQGRNPDKLDELSQFCRERGAAVRPQLADLRDIMAWSRSLGTVSAKHPVDLALINAGITGNIGVGGEGESWDSIEEILDVNLKSALATIQALLPSMRRRGRGQLALISSLSAYVGLPLTPAYCASKAALKSYGESLRGWLEPEGIAVNVVLPGFVESAMSARFPGPQSFVLDAEAAALRIQGGLIRNRARIAFPFPLSWGMWWLAVFPPSLSQRILRALGYGAPAPINRSPR